MTARTRFMDESVGIAAAGGARQLVVLAAGLDTRAHRLCSELRDIRVFELDLLSAHVYKRERLQRAGLLNDWRAALVPADLSSTTWISTLHEAGCDIDSVLTHVLWEGCTYYLTEDAVKQTLRLLRRPNVTLSFACGDRSILNDSSVSNCMAKTFSSIATRVGEPFCFGIEFDMLSDWLREEGWEVIDAVRTVGDVKRRFLPGALMCDEPFDFFALVTVRPIV